MPDALTGFAAELDVKLAAGIPAIAISTLERRRALAAVAEAAERQGRAVVEWLPDLGFQVHLRGDLSADEVAAVSEPAYRQNLHESLAAVLYVAAFPRRAVFAFCDAHELLADPAPGAAVTRSLLAHAVDNALLGDRQVVLIHPAASVHPDLDPRLEPLRVPLLTPAEIADRVIGDLAAGLEGATGLEGPGGAELRRRLGAACGGLTLLQATNVLGETLVRPRHGLRFNAAMLEDVRRHRAALINASGILRVAEPKAGFGDVVGLDALKRFLARLGRPRPAGARALPKGVLLFGWPGSGKTLVAEAWAKESGRHLVHLDVGSLMGGIVGQTEAATRRALEIIDGAGPAVVLLDEVDKHLAGAKEGGRSDGGVLARAFGSILQWLNDHTSDAVVVMTCNDAAGLPPELTRSGRLDASWFVDLPGAADRARLWDYYLGRYGLDPAQPRPDDADYAGADVAGCARLAELLGVPLAEAAEHVVPLAVTRRDELARLREQATNRYLDADLGGRSRPGRREAAAAAADNGKPKAAGGRSLRRAGPADPSSN